LYSECLKLNRARLQIDANSTAAIAKLILDELRVLLAEVRKPGRKRSPQAAPPLGAGMMTMRSWPIAISFSACHLNMLQETAVPTPLDGSVPLEALPASRSLIVLHWCPFVRLVTANNATCCCAKDAMVTSKMARSTAHHRTF